jgi:uncharacterized cupredoxin-like copper-binding protein
MGKGRPKMRKAHFAAAGAACLACVGLGATAVALAGGTRTASVRVTLSEMIISLSQKQVPAGKVTFIARNVGAAEHEFVVLRRASSGNLRVAAFKAEESGKIGEIEGVIPGRTRRTTLTLQPGRYILICNVPGHYQLGMRAELVVGG